MSEELNPQNTRLIELERRQADLERRINELEKLAPFFPKDSSPSPYQPINPWPNYPVKPYYPINNDPISCHICGVKASEGMFRVCNHPSCPSRVVYCTDKPYSTCDSTQIDKMRLIGGDIWGGLKPQFNNDALGNNNDISNHPSVLDGLINPDGTRKLPLDGAQ